VAIDLTFAPEIEQLATRHGREAAGRRGLKIVLVDLPRRRADSTGSPASWRST
jgi:hypothetical protein